MPTDTTRSVTLASQALSILLPDPSPFPCVATQGTDQTHANGRPVCLLSLHSHRLAASIREGLSRDAHGTTREQGATGSTGETLTGRTYGYKWSAMQACDPPRTRGMPTMTTCAWLLIPRWVAPVESGSVGSLLGGVLSAPPLSAPHEAWRPGCH